MFCCPSINAVNIAITLFSFSAVSPILLLLSLSVFSSRGSFQSSALVWYPGCQLFALVDDISVYLNSWTISKSYMCIFFSKFDFCFDSFQSSCVSISCACVYIYIISFPAHHLNCHQTLYFTSNEPNILEKKPDLLNKHLFLSCAWKHIKTAKH